MAVAQTGSVEAGATGRAPVADKSIGELLSELWALVLAYAKQETVQPLKALGRFVAYGMAGAVFLGIGCFFVALAIVRALQVELVPHLDGDWSWVPYTGGVLFLLLTAALAVLRIGKAPK